MSAFSQNVGPLDAAIRFVLGVAILVGAFVYAVGEDPDWLLTLLIHPAIFATYLIVTGAIRNDVAYHIFGWDTRRRERRPKPPRSPARSRTSP